MLLVLGVPLAAVVWGGIMLSTALSGKDSLVSDSYYKDGVNYTEIKTADEKAKRLQVKASMIFTDGEVHLTLNGYFDEYPNLLNIQLIHPTLEERDAVLLLQKMPDGSYAGPNDIQLPARRRIWLESPEQGWRIRSYEFIEAGKDITFSAQ